MSKGIQFNIVPFELCHFHLNSE